MENEQQKDMQSCACGGQCPCHSKWGKWNHKRHGGRGGMCGGMWFIGWLFTIGFLKLTFWKGVFALVVWPYFIGAFFAR